MKSDLDVTSLEYVLLMAQESLCPDIYEKFVEAYNELIKIRKLGLEPIDYYSIEA